MTPEQITKWAAEVGMPTVLEFGLTRFASPKQLHEFAKRVRNATIDELANTFETAYEDGEAVAVCIRSMK
jgi:hypothetical protein